MSAVIFDLAAIKARAEAATPGPWEASVCYTGDWMVATIGDVICVNDPNCRDETPMRNFLHIAGMDPPTTLALIAEVERLTRERDEARAQISDARLCFEAAFAEGLIDRLAEDYVEAVRVAEDSRDHSLWGLVERRLLPALDYLESSRTPASRMEARHG